MSWFWRGVQSAVFYYASCTPCLESLNQHRRKKEAARTRKERDILVTQQPSLVVQPTAFETNRYWAEEIAAGPGPPKGWRGHETLKKAHLKAQSDDASPNTSSKSRDLSKRDCEGHQRADEPLWDGVGDSLPRMLGRPKRPIKQDYGDRPSHLRHHRKSEQEWSLSDHFDSWKKSSNPYDNGYHSDDGYTSSFHESSEASYNPYAASARNPALNNLHPPIFTTFRDPGEVAWMKQPPPSADVMAGRLQHIVPESSSNYDESPDSSSEDHITPRCPPEAYLEIASSNPFLETENKSPPSFNDGNDIITLRCPPKAHLNSTNITKKKSSRRLSTIYSCSYDE